VETLSSNDNSNSKATSRKLLGFFFGLSSMVLFAYGAQSLGINASVGVPVSLLLFFRPEINRFFGEGGAEDDSVVWRFAGVGVALAVLVINMFIPWPWKW
jgi:hypothetical protein